MHDPSGRDRVRSCPDDRSKAAADDHLGRRLERRNREPVEPELAVRDAERRDDVECSVALRRPELEADGDAPAANPKPPCHARDAGRHCGDAGGLELGDGSAFQQRKDGGVPPRVAGATGSDAVGVEHEIERDVRGCDADDTEVDGGPGDVRHGARAVLDGHGGDELGGVDAPGPGEVRER